MRRVLLADPSSAVRMALLQILVVRTAYSRPINHNYQLLINKSANNERLPQPISPRSSLSSRFTLIINNRGVQFWFVGQLFHRRTSARRRVGIKSLFLSLSNSVFDFVPGECKCSRWVLLTRAVLKVKSAFPFPPPELEAGAAFSTPGYSRFCSRLARLSVGAHWVESVKVQLHDHIEPSN